MKLHLFAIALLLGVPQAPPPALGTLEGRVLKTGTSDPLTNTPVTLISSPGLSDDALAGLLDQIAQLVTIGAQGGGGGGNQDLTTQGVMRLLQNAGPGVSAQASILTDRAGHFAFPNLPRGRYTVWVQRFNYYGPVLNGIPTSTTSSTIAFDPAKPQPVNLFLAQGAAITGRVVDDRGQPAPGSSILAYRLTYNDGTPAWSQVLARQIDDRGEYRLSPLPPGDYYVGVNPSQNSTAPAGQDTSVRTFFPGVTESAAATKLTLKGGETPGVNFTLHSGPSALFKISGVALNPGGAPFANFTLNGLDSNPISSEAPNSFSNAIPPAKRTGGEFEIRNVRPGIYELYPISNFGGFLAGRTVVDVRNADADGVRVVVNPMVTLQGKITVTGANPQSQVYPERIRIVLKPLAAFSSRSITPPLAAVDADGRFSVSAPAGTNVMIQAIGLPDTAFVSDIRLYGSSVMDHGFLWPSTADPLEVIVDATTGATFEATVHTSDGLPGRHATVVLVPAEDRRQNPMWYKSGATDNDGRLTFRGVAPGPYTAFAWESISPTAWINREFIAEYLDQGTPVVINPGQQVSLQLKWIAFDTDRR